MRQVRKKSLMSLPEPLEQSAPLARSMAHHCCVRGGHGCQPYHGFWQYLRLMGLGKTMSGLAGHFLGQIRQEARQWKTPASGPSPQILVSGCADYSAWAHVRAACTAEGVQPTVTALDLCETPLQLTRWLADREGAAIETVQSDILEHPAQARYDLIVSSSFLGYFRGSQRPRLLASYARMLRPGGLLIVSNRIRAGDEERPIGFEERQIEEFARLVAERNASLPASIRLDPDEAIQSARDYARVMSSHPVNGRASIEPLLVRAGLAWFGVDGLSADPPSQHRLNAPTVADGSRYLLVVARKRRP